MSNSFITKKNFLKKLVIKALLVLMLLAGIFAFWLNQDQILHFKPYYTKSYLAFGEYKLYELKNILRVGPVEKSYGDRESIANAQGVPVLLYHSIIEKPDGHNVTVDNFKEQMFTLKKAGYTAITINDFNDFIKGKRTLPAKPILITFDDGAKDSFYPVDPILKAVDFKATTFIITKYSLKDEDRYYLTKNEVKKVIQTGRWDVQVHTKDGHSLYPLNEKGDQGIFYSNKLWLSDKGREETTSEYNIRIAKDMADAKNELEETFGVKSIGFAYPFGDFGQHHPSKFPEAQNIILKDTKNQYELAFHQSWQGASYPYSYNYPKASPFLVKRINVEADWTGSDLLELLETGKPKMLPLSDDLETNTGWRSIWGDITLTNNALIMKPEKETTGTSVYLDGTYQWKNYSITADMTIKKGDTFGILGRFQDDNNYLTCSYTGNSIVLEQKVEGKLTTLSEADRTTRKGQEQVLGMNVKGNTAECLVNGAVVTKSSKVSSQLEQGGFGFKSWDEKADNSEIIIESVNASAL